MTTSRKGLSRKCIGRQPLEKIPPKRKTRNSSPLSSDSEDEQTSNSARRAYENDLSWTPMIMHNYGPKKKNIKRAENESEDESDEEEETPNIGLSEYEIQIQKNLDAKALFLSSLNMSPAKVNLFGLGQKPTKKKKGKKENLKISKQKVLKEKGIKKQKVPKISKQKVLKEKGNLMIKKQKVKKGEEKVKEKHKRFLPMPMDEKSEDGAAATSNASLEASNVAHKHPWMDGTYFKIVGEDGDDVLCECTICANRLLTKKSHGNKPKRHLKSLHPERFEAAQKYVSELREAAQKYVSEQREIERKEFSENWCTLCITASKRRKALLETWDEVKQDEVDEALVVFVTEGPCSPSIVEQPAFIQFWEALNPNATLMSRETLESRIAELDITKKAVIEKPSGAQQ